MTAKPKMSRKAAEEICRKEVNKIVAVYKECYKGISGSEPTHEDLEEIRKIHLEGLMRAMAETYELY